MGACLSCLGLGRQEGKEDENPETSRLLYEDPYRAQYGSNNPNARSMNPQPDPEAQRYEREVMEGICHAMSDEVVDVFTVVPQEASGVGSRVQSKDHLHHALTEGKEPKGGLAHLQDYERSPQEMAYRSVRQSRPYVICSDMGKEESEAARVAMG